MLSNEHMISLDQEFSTFFCTWPVQLGKILGLPIPARKYIGFWPIPTGKDFGGGPQFMIPLVVTLL